VEAFIDEVLDVLRVLLVVFACRDPAGKDALLAQIDSALIASAHHGALLSELALVRELEGAGAATSEQSCS
jgi:hypothetical protein